MIIDLRSDTVTKPTKGMLDAMMSAQAGDDVYREDETVNTLEQKVASMFNKEEALFCPSGTMANQIAIKAHTQPGDELICEINSHIYQYESGGIAFNSGVQPKLLHGDRGRIAAQQLVENINPVYDWLPPTTLVSIENTVNKSGGSYYTINQIKEIAEVCKKNNLKLHLDGARIFNALIETKDTPAETGNAVDSISICLSKGLGAPVGSVLAGNKNFISKVRRLRKMMGGGMRQSGYLAAAGIYALDNHIQLLKEDHRRAKTIEEALKKIICVKTILPVDTNIIIFTLDASTTSEVFIKKLSGKNIKASAINKQTVRFVTHLDFTNEMLDEVVSVLLKERT